jgi:hypothetical protein
MSRDAKASGRQQLFGAALKTHKAKASGRQELFGAAKDANERKRLVGPAKEPMLVGESPVLQFVAPERSDAKVPWDGVCVADANFQESGDGVAIDEPTEEGGFDKVDAKLDGEPSEEAVARAVRLKVLLRRLERKEARRARKAIGRAKVEPGYQALERELQSAETTAQFRVREALAHHQHTKKELARCRQMLAKLRGSNPASPAVTGMAAHLPPNRILLAEAQVRAMKPAELVLPYQRKAAL